MKKILAVVALLSAVAWAAQPGSLVAVEVYPAGLLGPTAANAGIPLMGPDNQCVRSVNVSMMVPQDGGQGFQMTAISARAWKLTPYNAVQWDGGYDHSWGRWPALDIAYVTDAGAPYTMHGNGITLTQSVPCSAAGGRLFYQYDNLTVQDGGTLGAAHVVVEGRYGRFEPAL